MNDRFKFRWYSKIYNEMCDVNCIEPNNEFVNFQQGKFNDISTRINLGNGVLMQCTGLKDKNGKLIYEGDIVKFKNTDNKYYIGTIKYTDEDVLFCLSYRNENNRDDWDYVSKYRLEVIGNIYENKELLEE